MKISKLRNIIREEIEKLNEKRSGRKWCYCFEKDGIQYSCLGWKRGNKASGGYDRGCACCFRLEKEMGGLDKHVPIDTPTVKGVPVER